MSQRQSYFRFTTSQQRKLLFEIWEETGNVTEACHKAHVGRATFYYWKPRFQAHGYAGLEEFESRVAHKLNRKEESIEQSPNAMRRRHPDWGKFRIADELGKGNNWEGVASPNTIRCILKMADLWPEKPKAGRNKAA